jgi:hypothetical protein
MAATLQERLLRDLQSLVIALNLTAASGATGSVAGNVVVQWEEERLNLPGYPAVVLSCEDEAEDAPDDLATTEERGTTYPVVIKVLDQARTNYQVVRPDYLAWRHAIFMRLQDLPGLEALATPPAPILPNCPECAFMRVRYQPMKPDKKAAVQTAAAVVAECYCVEPRPN